MQQGKAVTQTPLVGYLYTVLQISNNTQTCILLQLMSKFEPF